MFLAQMGGAFQKPGMDVEDVARIGLAPRRAAQQKRQLAIGAGVAREIVIDDQDVAALAHEMLGHGRRSVGREELQPRRVVAARDHDDGALQRPPPFAGCR